MADTNSRGVTNVDKTILGAMTDILEKIRQDLKGIADKHVRDLPVYSSLYDARDTLQEAIKEINIAASDLPDKS